MKTYTLLICFLVTLSACVSTGKVAADKSDDFLLSFIANSVRVPVAKLKITDRSKLVSDNLVGVEVGPYDYAICSFLKDPLVGIYKAVCINNKTRLVY